MIYISSFIALILLLWFNSDAFTEYCKLFRLGKIFKIDVWEEYKKTDDVRVAYIQFLRMKYPMFGVKLITCPICFSIWLGLYNLIFFNIYQYSFIIIVSLFIYYGIVKLM